MVKLTLYEHLNQGCATFRRAGSNAHSKSKPRAGVVVHIAVPDRFAHKFNVKNYFYF